MQPLPYFWLLSATVLAQIQEFSPPGYSGISFDVNIPSHTASSGSGPIFFQLKSTHELEWFAWGQGSQMLGANIFVVYASSDGTNITVSPRLGLQHVMPTYNSEAKLTVLDGSGVNNGVMTANVRCDSCISWSGGSINPTSSSSSWVWAVKSGSWIESDSPSVSIVKHDNSGVASINLQQATGGSSENPFATLNGTIPSSSGSASTFNPDSVNNLRIAHAVIMIVAFAILFPSFALLLHVVPSSMIVQVHAFLQLFTLCLAIAGMGIGISMAQKLHEVEEYHPIIGIVTVSLLVLFQPVMGYLQHRHFLKMGEKGVFAYAHRWLGRILLALGVINGGLGFRLAGVGSKDAPTGAVVAYSVVVGVVAVVYLAYIVFVSGKGTRIIRRRT
ncbi:hypothetical protein N7532_002312 [Penicillium argentinense]|uniref:Cytochrome b561 domain-containing protein n=1 Tax=Penicillium argentinense TaxID=1131581 RepID=A0A9W9KLD9_9EURO|nr:uncharacterized protein N7532_002312 [Penicillium argentinense]KAJ5109667.1 hypothetical protein N7532_002312 [Penicillium argentinense]